MVAEGAPSSTMDYSSGIHIGLMALISAPLGMTVP